MLEDGPKGTTWRRAHLMTGRDGGADLQPIGNSPVVILVRPQLADNIGACARAMANGGLFHLRLVAPRDGWPQEKAWRTASGADRILDAATVHDNRRRRRRRPAPRLRHLPAPAPHRQAGADRPRRRGGTARDLPAATCAPACCSARNAPGLDNDDMAAADALVRYPAQPGVHVAEPGAGGHGDGLRVVDRRRRHAARTLMTNETRVATKGKLDNFLAHLVDQLDACGFLRNLPKRPGMVRNIRHFFQRGEVTEQELRTLHGVVTELAIGRRQRGRLEEGTRALPWTRKGPGALRSHGLG